MSPRSFDAIVIGAGQAGPPLATRLAAAGQRVALIERARLGGTCVNTGCTPTKAMVASAYAAHLARRADEYGVVIGGAVSVDMAAVRRRTLGIVSASREGLESWIGGAEGLTLITGHARFTDRDTLVVNGETLTAPRIFIDVGGRAVIPDYPGVETIAPLTNSTILDLDTVPEHLIVVGGGYIGLEYAQMFRRFGSAVTIVERGDRLIKKEDRSTSEAVAAVLADEGITLRLRADCIAFSGTPEQPVVEVNCSEEPKAITGSHVLMAVGRQPNTDDLGLDAAGIATDDRGYITVDEGLRTSVGGIWALGDCNGRGAFTHTAFNDYEIVAEALFEGRQRKVGDRVPVYALYTDPPLGRVGMTIAEAQAKGHTVLVGERAMTRVGRAKEKGETAGFMRIVADADSGVVLGGAIFGVGGDEAVHFMLGAVAAGAHWTTLKDTMAIHPTVSELIPTIAGEMKPVG